jgi:hypothetical protein
MSQSLERRLFLSLLTLGKDSKRLALISQPDIRTDLLGLST